MRGYLSACVLLLLLTRVASARDSTHVATTPPVRGTFQNPGLNASAGLVFAGTVLRVARSLIAARNQVPYFEIEFHVDRGIRGARSGQILRIREWAGLWTGGARYSPGQHVVLFLY